MALRQLLNEEHFNKFIDMFEDGVKKYNIKIHTRFSTFHKINLFCNFIYCDHYNVKINIKDNETQVQSLKHKMRLYKIYKYKLIIHIMKNNAIEYLSYKYDEAKFGPSFISKYDKYKCSFDVNCKKWPSKFSQEYHNYFKNYDLNYLLDDSYPTIYDDILRKTDEELKSLLNKIKESQKKIVKWYKKQKQIRKTRLLLTSYRQLNKRKFQLPTEIICNKILKLEGT